MGKARKTIDVQTLVRITNNMLANSQDERKDERYAMAILLETLLMEVNAYKGFKYLQIEFDENGKVKTLGDESRRAYFFER